MIAKIPGNRNHIAAHFRAIYAEIVALIVRKTHDSTPGFAVETQ
jgi:hypothetical protein